MKYLVLVGDGMGDLPIAELNNQTILEAAKTPAMDSLCRQGELFFTSTIPEGYPPGSDVANLSLMGYSPKLYYTGRAPLEAAAMGVTLGDDETVFRCNLVTLDYQENDQVEMVDFCAGHISSEEAAELIQALEKACGNEIFHFEAGFSYRHLLVVKDPYPQLDTQPPHDHIGKDVSPCWQRYLSDPQWQALLHKVRETLADHPVNSKRIADGKNPANGIWPWGEGKMPHMPTMQERFGISGSMISAVDLLKGIGVNAGLTVINVPGATGYLDTNYEGKAQAALDALDSQDFVFVHVESPDETGHQGLIKEKTQAIEDFDSRIVAPIIAGLKERNVDFRAVVTMDHFTPISLKTHTTHPVPTILYDSRDVSHGSGEDFCEKRCSAVDARLHNSVASGELLMKKLLERT